MILPFLRSGSKPFPSDRYVNILICNLEFYCFHIKFAKCRKCQLKQTGYFPKRAEPFSFRCAEFASFFAGRKAEQTFFSDFNTPCDSSRIRANRTWLIAKNTAAFLRCMLLHNITKMLSIMTPHRQMRRLFLKNKKLIISVALQIRENALWLYRRVLESVCWANRVLPETCIAFFFPLRGVCVVFRRAKSRANVLYRLLYAVR